MSGRERLNLKGQWEEAKGYYRQALTLNPTLVEARNNLGTLYVRQQQLTAAIDEFRAAIRLDPNYAMVRNNLGSAYFLSGQEALAIQEFLAALHIDGTYVSPLYNLASLYAGVVMSVKLSPFSRERWRSSRQCCPGCKRTLTLTASKPPQTFSACTHRATPNVERCGKA